MNAKRTSRLLAVLIAVVMIMTSGIGVFAAGSNTGGKTVPTTTVNYSAKTVTVNTPNASYSTNGGSTFKTFQGYTVKVKKGSTVVVSQSGTYTCVWMMKGKVSKAKKGKVTWKKLKGAKKYQLRIYNKNGKLVKKVNTKKLSYSSKKYLKKGYKVQVAACKTIKGKPFKNFWSVWSAKKKVK